MEVIKNNTYKFYTKPDVAKFCYDFLKNEIEDYNSFDMELEPSAGNGSFYKLFEPSKRYGIDIDPKCDGVVKQNFLVYYPEHNKKKIITIGNPPFGNNGSLAIKFFNHASEFSTIIAFILPRYFKNLSIKNKLNDQFQLLNEIECPYNSFIIDGNEYGISCNFQIWSGK